MQENSLATYVGDAPISPGSTSSSLSSSETDAEYIDNNVWPLDSVLELLKSEISRIECERHYIDDFGGLGIDWRYSSSFRDEMWENYRLWTDISQDGISEMHNCGFERYNQLLDASRQLKNTVMLLDLLKSTAQEVLEPIEVALKRASRKFGRFLNRLPLDLLAETIRFACSDSDVYELINMSHVNRRFRSVVLSMGDMWAHISSIMPIKILQLSLERSRNASLDLDGYFNEIFGVNDTVHQSTKTQAKSFIAEMAHCTSRWKNVRFIMPKSSHRELETESYELYVLLSATLPRDLHVPRLKTLSIDHRGCAPDSRNNEANSRVRVIEAVHFYHSWNAPNLRMLNFRHIVPAPIRGASIEALSLDLRRSYGNVLEMDFFVALQDLVSFLQETPSLQTLRLSCPTCSWTDFDGDLAFPAITLENLHELTLVLSHQWAPLGIGEIPLTLFTNCIRVPNLITVTNFARINM